jgi:hypothetical protein
VIEFEYVYHRNKYELIFLDGPAKLATECVFSKTNPNEPVPGYMNNDEDGVKLSCRSQQILVTKQPAKKGEKLKYCCKNDPNAPKSSTPILAQDCAFQSTDIPYSWSLTKPGSDLICSAGMELFSATVKDSITSNSVSGVCCRKIPTTTTSKSK